MTRIIKKNDVVMDGAVKISKTASVAGRPPVSAGGSEKISAKIIDRTSEFLVIEINCPCGRKSFIKCQYTKDQTADTEKQ